MCFWKNYWGPLFNFSRRATRDADWLNLTWPTYLLTHRQTWVGARDTCVSKNEIQSMIRHHACNHLIFRFCVCKIQDCLKKDYFQKGLKLSKLGKVRGGDMGACGPYLGSYQLNGKDISHQNYFFYPLFHYFFSLLVNISHTLFNFWPAVIPVRFMSEYIHCRLVNSLCRKLIRGEVKLWDQTSWVRPSLDRRAT